MKYDKVFKELRKKYTLEEIADSMLIPADLTEEEKTKANDEIREYRMKMLAEMTDEDRILSDVMRLRFQIEGYVKDEEFSKDKTFGKFLEEYVRIVNRSRREIADNLALHYTKLSRIINDKEEPNIELCYRLEKHSSELIKAETWWKLIIKKQEFVLSKDKKTKKAEQKKVKNPIKVRA